MDLNSVRMFVAVVQAGSLSAASVRLGVPLPTLSRRVRQLEDQLHVQLLERTAHGAKLTDAGSRLYEHACLGIETLLEAEQAILMDQARIKGRLRLSVPQSFEPWWELLANFQRSYPDVQVCVHTTERRVDLLEESIDVALRVGRVAHENLVARHLLSYRHVLVASPRLIEQYGRPSKPADLANMPCAGWSSGIDSLLRWQLGAEVIELRSEFSVNDYHHLRHRALSGDVVTELPPFLAAGPIHEGRLTPLLEDFPLPEWPINLIYPSHRHQSSIVRTYLSFCLLSLPAVLAACDITYGESTPGS